MRKRLRISGVVQGVGFRPFVWRSAHRLDLAGWVENVPDGVVVEVEGEPEAIDALLSDIRDRLPPLAAVERVAIENLSIDSATSPGFSIRESAVARAVMGDHCVAVPADMATCAACLADVRDPAGRRFRYPFTNCTDCGPRYTIIRDLPYDRLRTTMQGFVMCAACAAEYADPGERRFHAQPNACSVCGPIVWFTTAVDRGGLATERAAAACLGDDALAVARERLLAGDVLAIKGLGGFHLVCDAASHAAVDRLRERKQRVAKPLAVMVADAEGARGCAMVDEQERRLLESGERPIVLLRKRAAGGGLSPAIAPGNDFVGVMLPSMPLHHLLCTGMPPLVMTSGNLSEEPIVHDNPDAVERLAPLVDGFLMHDRDIHVACDDSVVRCVAGAPLPIRRSRGYAPLPIRLAGGGRSVLAVGGELKAALCIAGGSQAVVSQHIGDMGNLQTLESLEWTASHLLRLFDIVPEAVVADMHPGYLSTQWARRFAADRGIAFVQVQHHEAHVAALLADHGVVGMPLVGVCFDGTGYGADGTIWGGEVFVTRPDGLDRAAHLDPFPLPGGDASIRHPWRVALALAHAAGCVVDERLAPYAAASPEERRIVEQQLERNLACVATSSMGRLFDAVAALAGVRQSITYEAEAAMNLEALAAAAGDVGPPYAFALREPAACDAPLRIDWRPVVEAVIDDMTAGVAAAVVAARFHRGVAGMIAAVCSRLRARTGIGTVGLTGGVFQNALLVRLTLDKLSTAGCDVLIHQRVPPNDGGLALGQAVLGRKV